MWSEGDAELVRNIFVSMWVNRIWFYTCPGIKVPADQDTSSGLVVTDLFFRNGKTIFIIIRGFWRGDICCTHELVLICSNNFSFYFEPNWKFSFLFSSMIVQGLLCTKSAFLLNPCLGSLPSVWWMGTQFLCSLRDNQWKCLLYSKCPAEQTHLHLLTLWWSLGSCF